MRKIGYEEKVLEKIIISIIITTHLEQYTRQSCLALTHLSQGLIPPILTVVTLQYFSCCLFLVFLKGYCPSSSLAAIFLYLDPTTQDLSALSNRVASLSSTSSWSYWRYSTILLFLSSFSAILCLSAFFWAFSSVFLLAF